MGPKSSSVRPSRNALPPAAGGSISGTRVYLAMLLIVWESLWSLHGRLYDDRQIKTRHLVEAVVGVLDHSHGLQAGSARR